MAEGPCEMNSTVLPVTSNTGRLWEFSFNDSAAAWQPRSRRRRKPWYQRAGILAAVVTLQCVLGFALTQMHVNRLPSPPSPFMVTNIAEVPPVQPDVVPPPPAKVVPIPVEVPVVFDVAPDNAISLPKEPEKKVAVSTPGGGVDARSVVVRYQMMLLRHLAAYKRYPQISRTRRQEGVVMVKFTMDRAGRVLSASLASAPHFTALDEEGVAILRRATPLPAPPAELQGDPLSLVVPIEFALH
jgi:TonB family protein